MSLMHYGEAAYWEARYEDEIRKNTSGQFENFDWYCNFEAVYVLLESIIDTKKPQKILVLGVGRSNVIDVLYKRGFRDITCIDISPILISQMQNKYRGFAGVEFFVMDTRDLYSFSDKAFTLIIDKGCYDAVCCGLNLYESSERYCQEVFRVLNDECICALVSHAPPLARVPYLRSAPWAIDTCAIPEGDGITLYVLLRTQDQEILQRKIAGAEISIRKKSSSNAGSTSENVSKSSSVRQAKNAGKVSVTADVHHLAALMMKLESDTS